MRVILWAMLLSAGCAQPTTLPAARDPIEVEHEHKLLEPNQRHALEIDEHAPVESPAK